MMVTGLIYSCNNSSTKEKTPAISDPHLTYKEYESNPSDLVISRAEYKKSFMVFGWGNVSPIGQVGDGNG